MNTPQPERFDPSSDNGEVLEFEDNSADLADKTKWTRTPEEFAALMAERERWVEAGLLPPWPGPKGEEPPSAKPAEEKPK